MGTGHHTAQKACSRLEWELANWPVPSDCNCVTQFSPLLNKTTAILLMILPVASLTNTFFFFLGPHPWYIEVPRLGVELELQLQLPAYMAATAMWDPSHMYDLHHSSEQ